MEIVNRNGKTYFVPANDLSDSSGITNFSKWEQAFRVYSNIYCKRFPDRSSELIQYNHVIHTAALSYTWENVYLYNRDFRLHLSRYPHHSWAVILQQAWTMRLKDRNKGDANNVKGGNANGGGSKAKRGKRDFCWLYNSGNCTFPHCKFPHKCAICSKYSHGAHICRKVMGFEQTFSPKNNNRDNDDHWYSKGYNNNNSNNYHKKNWMEERKRNDRKY